MLLKTAIGRLIISAILNEFISWLKICATKKYGYISSPRLDYVMNFLDGLEEDINIFINLPDLKAPIIEVDIDKLRKKK